MFPATEDVVDWFQNCEFIASRPKHITPEILRFCGSLEADAPVIVEIQPTPNAEVMRCFGNVAEAVADGHGETQTGWLIWEFPGVYLNAERHAVLKTPDGYVDLTPQPDGHRRVLFAPTALPPSGDYTPCRYSAMKDHPYVHRFVELMSRNQILFGTGQFRNAEFRRNDSEAAKYLRMYLALRDKQQHKQQTKDRRAKRKAERQRRRAMR